MGDDMKYSKYTTKVTWLGDCYGCRVFHDNKLIMEARCGTKDLIGPTFRDMLRTLDKMGGDRFTNAARYRQWQEGNKAGRAKLVAFDVSATLTINGL